MKDDTLEKIKEFAVNLLRKEKGYCGVASNDDSAIITSECPSGFDIKITIETKAV